MSNRRPAPQTANQRMLAVFSHAQQAMPANFIVRPGGTNGEDRVLINKTMSALAGLTDFLSFGAELTGLLDEDGHVSIDPPYQDASKSITVEAAMSQSSRVLAAGATLIQGAEMHQNVRTTGGRSVMARSSISLSTFQPISFEHKDFDADQDAELGISPVPFSTLKVDLDAFQQYGVAFRLSRREIKDLRPERLAVQLLWPLIQGMGRAVDAAFFAAFRDLSLNDWALGEAALQGLSFESLRAVVGTDGLGATTDQGNLYAGGVPAALTPDTAGSIVGAFTRAAMVTDEEIKIIATRTGVDGGLEVTCWLGLQPLIPDPSKFWIIPAPEETAPDV
jgi:hypothetical protein